MNQLNKQITDAMAKLSISKRELSLRLGKSQNYLGDLQRIGCSTEKQAELIAKIQLVIDVHGFKSDKEIIAELKEKLAKAEGVISQHGFHTSGIQRENLKQYNELKELKEYIADQERHHKDIREWNTNLHKTAQNAADRILDLEGMISTIDTENDKLRETVRKQEAKIALLNNLLGQANKNTQHWVDKFPKTWWAAFKLMVGVK